MELFDIFGEIKMKKLIIISIILSAFFSQSIFAYESLKFDLTLFFGLGTYSGLGNTSVDSSALPSGYAGSDPVNMGLNIHSINGGFSWDLIFLTPDKNYYGHGFTIFVEISSRAQSFKSLQMTNGQTDGFFGETFFTQTLDIVNIAIAPMYRFHVTRDFNVGVGPNINIISSSGTPGFVESDVYTNETTGLGQYYTSPQFGSLYLSLLADVQYTRFFGNFGVMGMVFGEFLLSPLSVGFGSRVGVKYRFNP